MIEVGADNNALTFEIRACREVFNDMTLGDEEQISWCHLLAMVVNAVLSFTFTTKCHEDEV